MISHDYKEIIRWNDLFKSYEVVRKIDKTGEAVCLECNEIITKEEDEGNGCVCDYCAALVRADRINEQIHPNERR